MWSHGADMLTLTMTCGGGVCILGLLGFVAYNYLASRDESLLFALLGLALMLYGICYYCSALADMFNPSAQHRVAIVHEV
jgi:hypothetical protein